MNRRISIRIFGVGRHSARLYQALYDIPVVIGGSYPDVRYHDEMIAVMDCADREVPADIHLFA